MKENESLSETAASLAEAARLFSIYLRLPILVTARSAVPVEAFSRRAVFLEGLQPFYQPRYLRGLLESEPDRSIRLLEDPLGTRAVLALADGTAVLIGPFVTEAYQEKRSRQLLSPFLPPDSDLLLRFKLYWCDLGLSEEEAVLRAVRSMLAYASISPNDFVTGRSFLTKKDSQSMSAQIPERKVVSWEESVRKTEARYENETRLMYEITRGDREKAVAALRQVLEGNRPQADTALDLWSMDAANSIMRTLIRISAKESGLPSAVIDAISLDYAQRMHHLGGDYRKLNRLYEGMISDICREIRRMREKGFSPLTHRALQIIRTRYAEPLRMVGVAGLLGVSESTLARSLKADTGRSFTQLLREERLKAAAHLLATTDRSVQEISSLAGIDDQNYFVKVFRSAYNMTPTDYRAAVLRGEVSPGGSPR